MVQTVTVTRTWLSQSDTADDHLNDYPCLYQYSCDCHELACSLHAYHQILPPSLRWYPIRRAERPPPRMR